MKAKPTSSADFLKTASITENAWTRKERNKPRLRNTGSGRRRIAEMETRRVPVLMRGTVSGLPMATPRRATNTQRRLEVPLGVPGAEIRLPSLVQIQVGWRMLSALLSFGLIALLYLLWTAPLFKVDTVNFQGLQRIRAKEISTELDIEEQPIFAVDPQLIREKLIAQFPEFRSVEVNLQFPNKVYIRVDERKPLFVWKLGDRTLLVDSEGYAFPLRGEGNPLPKLVIEAQDLPLPTSTDPQTDLQQLRLPVELVSGILSISALVPDGARLFYDGERGLGWHDPRGWTVYFGALKDISLKMKIYELMVKKIKKEKQKPLLISIEYVHAPYYRLER